MPAKAGSRYLRKYLLESPIPDFPTVETPFGIIGNVLGIASGVEKCDASRRSDNGGKPGLY